MLGCLVYGLLLIWVVIVLIWFGGLGLAVGLLVSGLGCMLVVDCMVYVNSVVVYGLIGLL